jgi:hypothetical protein
MSKMKNKVMNQEINRKPQESAIKDLHSCGIPRIYSKQNCGLEEKNIQINEPSICKINVNSTLKYEKPENDDPTHELNSSNNLKKTEQSLSIDPDCAKLPITTTNVTKIEPNPNTSQNTEAYKPININSIIIKNGAKRLQGKIFSFDNESYNFRNQKGLKLINELQKLLQKRMSNIQEQLYPNDPLCQYQPICIQKIGNFLIKFNY